MRDEELYPTLTEHGRAILEFMREHPAAPIYRSRSGHRLSAADLAQVRAFEARTLEASIERAPGWLEDFLASTWARVPYYRALGPAPRRLDEVSPISRADLAGDIARFVPDDVPLDGLIQFSTSGTTGHPLVVASHPVVAARYLTFHKRALRRFGITLRHGRGRVGVVLVGFQRSCFTYVSVTPTMDESGLAKLNLYPSDWRDPDDRARYLDALDAEVLTGDPISLAELAELPLTTRPRALLSTSMTLTEGLRARLEARFGCPVLDLYSMNEAGPLAVHEPTLGGHALLQPCMHVEILDSRGHPVPAGERGEITLTGGFNFCLPLLRYRTGDHAALHWVAGEPVLFGLDGRPPVRYRTVDGIWLNNVEITHLLRPFVVTAYALHQRSDGSFLLRLAPGTPDRDRIVETLEAALGTRPEVREGLADKTIQYTSEVAGAAG